jgi:hypothetical protein
MDVSIRGDLKLHAPRSSVGVSPSSLARISANGDGFMSPAIERRRSFEELARMWQELGALKLGEGALSVASSGGGSFGPTSGNMVDI